MPLVVRNGTVVTAAGLVDADVVCADGRIAGLVEPGSAATDGEVVDADGCLVFPGFIDPHVHSRDPGLTHKETFAHSTLGALCGGVTTVLEMPNAIPPVTDAAMLAQRRAEHEAKAWVDFGLWGLALGPGHAEDIQGLFAAGAVAVKLFWGYALHRETKTLVYNFADEPPENLLLPPEAGDVRALFREVAATGGVLGMHCEDRHVLARAGDDLGHPIETYDDLLAARPAVAEAVSIAIGAQLAAETGARFHVVHAASAAGIDVVRQARAAGAPVTAETCPQYLTLSDADAERLGPLLKVYPPVRTAADQEALWRAVDDGTVSSVGSDHAPHTVEEKMVGFAAAPAGGLGVETMVPLLVDAMVEGKLSAARLAEVASTATAKLYGLWPRKGSVQPGTDADLTIVDPRGDHEVRNEDLHALHPASAWHGRKVHGRIVASVLRGELAMRDGQPVGDHRGRFVPATHTP
ncbi:MAG: amidohydrolase family protein [Streptosporangiales bacterium]|nr:amidohydrolase family protein [Streptosporangiales bacterium]